MLQRVRELVVQKENSGVYGTTGEAVDAIDNEISEPVTEINRIGTSTKFAGVQVFHGASRSFQVGAYDGDVIAVDFDAVTSTLDNTSNVAAVDAEIATISDFRATLGATQNRLEHTVAKLRVTVENLQASESRVRDTDMAQVPQVGPGSAPGAG